MEVKFPAVKFPPLIIRAGSFLNITLLGTGIVVPPNDLTIFPEIELLPEVKLFDIDDITKPILDALSRTPEDTWRTVWNELNRQVAEYYERRAQE